jgi:hypothetical protein
MPCIVSAPAYAENSTHRADWEIGLARIYEHEDFGGTSPFSPWSLAVVLFQYITLLFHLAQLLAQLAKLFAFVGGGPFSAFPLVSVGLLYPAANGWLC